MRDEAEIIEEREARGESRPNFPLNIERPPIAGCCLGRRDFAAFAVSKSRWWSSEP
jgi:hypothetical protein